MGTYEIGTASPNGETYSPAGSGCDYALEYLQNKYSTYYDEVTTATTALATALATKDAAKAAMDTAMQAMDPMRESCRAYEEATYAPTIAPSSPTDTPTTLTPTSSTGTITWRMDNPEGSLAMVTTEGACTAIQHDCETDAECVAWGAPYIHNSHIDTPLCWGGSNPSVAPCGQTPSDANHRRLCPCEASVEEMD